MEKSKREFWPILVIILTYILAVYCCIIELLLDFFCDSAFTEKFISWKKKVQTEDVETKGPKFALVTGADGTIGIHVTEHLLNLGYEVIALGIKAPDLVLTNPDQLRFIQCDLLHDESLKKALVELDEMNLSNLDLAVFVAGVMLHAPLDKKNSKDPHFVINLLSHAKLLEKLRPLMEKSSRPNAVFVSSSTSRLGDTSDIFVESDHAFCEYINGYKSYADSKLAVNLYCCGLAQVLADEHSKLRVFSIHPGVVPGGLYRYVFGPAKALINNILPFILRTPDRAAAEILNAVYSDTVQSGDYVEYNRAASFMNFTESQLQNFMKNVRREIS
ncbi:unnamed protein product [Bursaphelenchus okinawaensis]|uniref:Epimerase domain-containing protein n=1 Tax=Bursaphelenchus okinawaensis TaxID=465554 RepID=A0A811LSR1_9BILA|nr:unnamed protein product [Bursaphelenchus okinawaensis]CAG9127512.1 unnamed protein product [Bursaphelenchus okinawaensis]